MAWWSFLTAAPNAAETGVRIVEKSVDGIIAGIDKAFYTPEEKAIAQQKATETIISLWKMVAVENSEQSKARRDIAFIILRVYFSLIFMAIAVVGLNPSIAAMILKFIEMITFLVTGVSFIYFGPHQIQKLLNKD